MKRAILYIISVVTASLSVSLPAQNKLTDKYATTQTKKLFENMTRLANTGCMSGHHDGLAYGVNWFGEKGRSDYHDVVGDYPAVFGWDVIELERAASMDVLSQRLVDMKEHIRHGYKTGAINTICWHMDNPVTGKDAWDISSKEVVKSVLPGGIHHEKYKAWLDRFVLYMDDIKDTDGSLMPIIFRPFHELTGSWFWWGKDLCSPEDFKAMWVFTYNYLVHQKHMHNLVFAYCTAAEVYSESEFLERYPGDEYVDMIGFDNYQGKDENGEKTFVQKTSTLIDICSKLAKERGKLFAVMEAGYESISPNNKWFTEILYPLLDKKGCSYILFWRNAHDFENHYYVPYSGHPAAADLIEFAGKESILSLSQIGDVYSNPFKVMTPQKDVFTSLLLSEITAKGWLRNRMLHDMNGFVGKLDQMVPNLITNDDIYGKNRLSRNIKSKNVGTTWAGGDWEIQTLWWNSETQSNWRDGYVRAAMFLQEDKWVQLTRQYINHILSTQDDDGYLGIYEPDLRYNFSGENGELWSKSSLFRVLLAYYEFTSDQKVLDAVERAMQNMMDNYPIYASKPFDVGEHYGGVGHGLTITDALDRLYQLTGNIKYREYALFLYQDYSNYNLLDKDIKYSNIVNPRYRLQGHGVHTYEQIRSLLLAARQSGNSILSDAFEKYMERVDRAITPAGGAIGDEDLKGRSADPTHIGYEYCSLHELFATYMEIVKKTGNIVYAEKAEKLFYNAAQGARHPVHSSICYLKTDNSYEMSGPRNGKDDPDRAQTRYKYSPVHQDAAVCCSPMAGRITPYFVHNMFMKDDSGITAMLFGETEIKTKIKGTDVHIVEQTKYPYTTHIQFSVSVNEESEFEFRIRKPAWAKGVKTNLPYKESGGCLIFSKTWNGKTNIEVAFEAGIDKYQFNDEVYFSYGPLVLAAPIEAKEEKGREYLPEYTDLYYKSQNLDILEYKNGAIKQRENNMEFDITLYSSKNKKEVKKTLVPVGETILRQVTFK